MNGVIHYLSFKSRRILHYANRKGPASRARLCILATRAALKKSTSWKLKLKDLEERIIQMNNSHETLQKRKMQTFERVLWRALCRNLYMNYAEIEEPIVDPV